MSTAVTMVRIAEVAPRPSARITGMFISFYLLTAVFGEFFLKGMVADGDCSGLRHISLFRSFLSIRRSAAYLANSVMASLADDPARFISMTTM
jgi:hypothetical protein